MNLRTSRTSSYSVAGGGGADGKLDTFNDTLVVMIMVMSTTISSVASIVQLGMLQPCCPGFSKG